MTTINANTFKTAIVALAKSHMRATFSVHGSLLAALGNDGLVKLHKTGAYWATKSVKTKYARISKFMNADGSLNDETLTDAAFASATAHTENLAAKVNAKVGALQNVKVERLAGFDFKVSGQNDAGQTVEVVQQVIINRSKLGKEFNQFPCRVYVNGQLTAAE